MVGGLPSTRRALSPRPMPRSIRPLLISFSSARVDAVTDGSRVAGLVTHVPSRMLLGVPAIRVSAGYGSRHRTWESNTQPWAKPRPRPARQVECRPVSFSSLRVNPKSMSVEGIR